MHLLVRVVTFDIGVYSYAVFVAIVSQFFFYCYCDHLDLHVLSHSFPTRRSSDLQLDSCCSCKGSQPRFLRALAGAASRAAIFCRRAAIFCRFLPVEEKVADLLEFSGKIFDPTAFLIVFAGALLIALRSEEHTSEHQSLMRISYAVFCLKKK